MNALRVLVAATSAVTRAGLEALLSRSDGIVVVGSATGAAAVASRARELDPDVILVARGAHEPLPDASALAGGEHTHPVVLLTTTTTDPAETAAALRAGVRGVLAHDASAEEIVAALSAAAAGLVVMHADGVGLLAAASQPAPRQTGHAITQPLTPRELEVLGMLAEGLANKAIAPRLGISEHTVKAHVAAIFAKLHATTRAEAVALGVRHGLIML